MRDRVPAELDIRTIPNGQLPCLLPLASLAAVHILLHDHISQRIPQRVILVQELETRGRVARAG